MPATFCFARLDNKLSRTSGLLPRRVPPLVPGTNDNPVYPPGGSKPPPCRVPTVFSPSKCIANKGSGTVVAPPIVTESSRYS
ncbi:hypothetical protein CDAR_36101 [Caerostris darwini]|uniref:Uncharacterized protein n=1 Tax=Caerostris darwini TaxID=1538125 RepID=A0AAV4VCY7_9ARAC|nr:hypothetical protein CDAR_36101 [Caerostris darwini]